MFFRPLLEGGDGTGADSGIVTLPGLYLLHLYYSLMEFGWRFDDIGQMDILGFLRIRAWDARRKNKKKEPRQAYVDEVWLDLK